MKKTLLLIALALGACSPSGEADRTERPDWFLEPSAPVRADDGPPIIGVEQASQALMSNAMFFGTSHMGSNYTCSPNGSSCVCDPLQKTGKKSTDCSDLAKQCDDRGMKCFWGGHRLLCHCFTGTHIDGCSPIDDVEGRCAYASWVAPSGLLKISGGDGTIFRRLTEHDRSCAVTGAQWAALGSPAPLVVSGNVATSVSLTYSGQYCTNVEAGTMENTWIDKHYRAPNGSIYKKVDGRACAETWQFYVNDGQPEFQQMSDAIAADFLNRYGGTQLCNARDQGAIPVN